MNKFASYNGIQYLPENMELVKILASEYIPSFHPFIHRLLPAAPTHSHRFDSMNEYNLVRYSQLVESEI